MTSKRQIRNAQAGTEVFMNRRPERSSECTVVGPGGSICISTILLTFWAVSTDVRSGMSLRKIGSVWVLILRQETMDLTASIASATTNGKRGRTTHHSTLSTVLN